MPRRAAAGPEFWGRRQFKSSNGLPPAEGRLHPSERVPQRLERAGERQAEMARRAESGARHDGHAGLVQQHLAQVGVIGEAETVDRDRSVGKGIERAFARAAASS